MACSELLLSLDFSRVYYYLDGFEFNLMLINLVLDGWSCEHYTEEQ